MAATPALTKVFVGNLAFSTTDEELKQAFAPAGNVYVLFSHPFWIFVFNRAFLRAFSAPIPV
jgi:hypothetical protein